MSALMWKEEIDSEPPAWFVFIFMAVMFCIIWACVFLRFGVIWTSAMGKRMPVSRWISYRLCVGTKK